VSKVSAYELRWARLADEPEIRALVGGVGMPGAVSVRFAREPDYFLGTTIMGDQCEVLVARHQPDGQLVGMGCRAEGRACINGRKAPLGYIGQIRVAHGHRGAWLVQQGAQWFREAGEPGLLYFGVIATDNPKARGVLTGARLPAGVHVRRMCGITTLGIMLRGRSATQAPGINVEPASRDTIPEVIDFWEKNGSKRQFFPAYQLTDFTEGARMRGLLPEDLMIARRRGRIVGVMAAWDQASFKQDIVEGYGPVLQRLRPIYNAGARLLGFSGLTPPGQAIPLAFAACVCVADDDIGVMRALLETCSHHALRRGKAFLMLGLADQDPLLTAARERAHISYHSDLFAACWAREPLAALDGRIPYIEIATL
jgi:hypothetical protein